MFVSPMYRFVGLLLLASAVQVICVRQRAQWSHSNDGRRVQRQVDFGSEEPIPDPPVLTVTGEIDASQSEEAGDDIRASQAPNLNDLGEVKWSQFVRGSQVKFSRSYFLGRGYPEYTYGSCSTPRGGPGSCKFIYYCPSQEIRRSFDTFLSHTCRIDDNYIGVCCPKPNVPATQSQSPKTDSKCGLKRDTTTDSVRVVGGRPAEKGAWPWVAALMLVKEGLWIPFCGGSLVSDRHVLTAAHCYRGLLVKKFSVADVRVRLGEHNFNEASDDRREYAVTRFIEHPKYQPFGSHPNDIALIELAKTVTFNRFISPICLPPAGESLPLDGESPFIAGWGHTSFLGTGSSVLLEADLSVTNLADCQNKYRPVNITRSQICAADPMGKKDACQGDSGGPLMTQMRSGQWAVIGVVSFGRQCGGLEAPGVYTRVASYLDWL